MREIGANSGALAEPTASSCARPALATFAKMRVLPSGLIIPACYCLAYGALAPLGSEAATVKLSNVALPTDQNGEKLITGEADVLKHGDTYYLYFNNWGPCPGVDCCKTSAGCATCCFARCARPGLLHSCVARSVIACRRANGP